MAETLKMGLRLLIFTLMAGLLLGLTNEVTKGPIAEQAAATANAARQQVISQADEFVQMQMVPGENWPDLEAVYAARKGGETVGYTFLVAPHGYKADIEMTLGVTAGGAVTELTINSLSETAGLGSKVADAPFLSQFEGIAADSSTVTADVDTITGATVSSKAVLSGVTQAFCYLKEQLGIEGHAAVLGATDGGEIERMLEALRAQGADEAVARIEQYLEQGGGAQ